MLGLPSIDLIHPTLVARPFHRDGWIYEEKYDGWRMPAYNRGSQVQLVSRAGRDHTRRFPALAAAIAKLSPDALVLDGEVCISDRHSSRGSSGYVSALTVQRSAPRRHRRRDQVTTGAEPSRPQSPLARA